MEDKKPISVDDNKQKSVLKAYVDNSIEGNDKLDAVIGEDAIMMRRPRDPSLTRRERHKARHRRRKRMYIALTSIISAAAILMSVAWYLFCPIWGYGDLSETVDADVINKARARFTVEEYYDKKESFILSYNIYIPFNYDPIMHYPMVLYIADDASVGDDVRKPLMNSFGGAVWATDAAQAENPCFVVVPNYPENTMNSGMGNISRYADITSRMVDSIAHKYGIDATRIYGVGEDMGASMLIYMDSEDPDTFNTLLLADDSRFTPDLGSLSDNRFIYFAAAGDGDAVEHQQTVKAALDDKGIEYGELSDIDASAPVGELNAAAEQMLAQGCDQNFITWRSGTVGLSFGGEHRAAYRFGVKIDTVRDWIFM